MPGYVIHLATASEYMKKHQNEIKNKDNFFKGCIAPDLTTKENKVITHYGQGSDKVELRKFLKDKDIDSDFNKGYFLHLITDYIFYNKLLECISKQIYNDYDILNDYLIKKYNVELLEEVKDKVFYKDEGETQILHKELAEKIIDIASEISLENVKNEILSCEYTEKWDKIRPLKRGINMEDNQIVKILYTNWKGETSYRNIIPINIEFKSTEWHKEEQWIMNAFDVDKQADRGFAIKDIKEWNV